MMARKLDLHMELMSITFDSSGNNNTQNNQQCFEYGTSSDSNVMLDLSSK